MEKLIKLTKEQIRVENAIEKIESMIKSGKGDYETLKKELYAKYNMLSKIKDAIIAF